MNNTKLTAVVLNALAVCNGYAPGEDELNRIVFLADWQHALKTGKTMTGLTWHKRHDEPFLREMGETIARDDAMSSSVTSDRSHRPGYVLKPGNEIPQLNPVELDSLEMAFRNFRDSESQALVREIASKAAPRTDVTSHDTIDLEDLARRARMAKAEKFADEKLPAYKPLLDKLAQ